MNKKFLAVAVICLVALPFIYLGSAYAKNAGTDEGYLLPQEDGTYDVPNHKDWKLRVIVHRERPVKSNATSLVCNLSDPESLATISSAGWRLPSGIWTYALNTSTVPSSVGSANLSVIVENAFSKWSGATGSSNKVFFAKSSSTTTKTRASQDGKNIIAWGTTPSNALGVTYTWYYKTTGVAVEVDTIMNRRVSWSWSNPATWTSPLATCASSNAYDAQDILTHELGHWMGLADMYDTANYQNATMYGYGSKAEIKKDTLSAGDVAGIQAIYP
ncbi:MAG: hypothetical protein A2599_01445 [Candidatus Staskawiczbacteria bacterium RIFOXYD1_FULL_39_28]|uniref:Peptidase M10 metallopeptidase domain-containing protein n=1 Tax=Candidatus Staskawiczbacteria bacterium RIFOXYC1_FULL_38_18 TaxID=1802229 RepID=A0A1G2J9U6_9BACT|nr:MAG: hypothetical protein A2401_00185 [Candidatus Staskawiczbacteria bacterium RIFOXYC1_FULL_38_18]OGZ91985.1 MAG: hypothetical protein A2599_01445 [Candidatus Staskawiczbacteria bacterium RIFOXYD1_FULL_39_28]